MLVTKIIVGTILIAMCGATVKSYLQSKESMKKVVIYSIVTILFTAACIAVIIGLPV